MHILDAIRAGGTIRDKAIKLCEDYNFNPIEIGCAILRACGYVVTEKFYGALTVKDKERNLLSFVETKNPFDGRVLAEEYRDSLLFEDICFELNNFFYSEDKETTDSEWVDVFYSLLCRVQNAIDCGLWIENYKESN